MAAGDSGLSLESSLQTGEEGKVRRRIGMRKEGGRKAMKAGRIVGKTYAHTVWDTDYTAVVRAKVGTTRIGRERQTDIYIYHRVSRLYK